MGRESSGAEGGDVCGEGGHHEQYFFRSSLWPIICAMVGSVSTSLELGVMYLVQAHSLPNPGAQALNKSVVVKASDFSAPFF